MNLPMNINTKTAAVILIVASLAVGIFVGLSAKTGFPDFSGILNLPGKPGDSGSGGEVGRGKVEENKVVKFTSQQDFLDYLAKGQEAGAYGYGSMLMDGGAEMMGESGTALTAPLAAPKAEGLGGGGPDRISQTNVQVAGIDEPDIVKTDGKEIYFALYKYGPIFYEQPMQREQSQGVEIFPQPLPSGPTQQVKLLKAYPPADLAEDGKIDKYGNLLLSKNTLVIFADNDRKIYGYDVTKPQSPHEDWKLELQDNTYVVTARLYRDKVYVITSTRVNYSEPCPIVPLKFAQNSLTIPCERIYHPVVNFPADVTYTVMVVDPATGEVQDNVAFVGSQRLSVVYMSENAVYLTYSYPSDLFGFLLGFLKDKTRDLLPGSLITRLEKVYGYELSDATKLTEFMSLLMNYMNSLSQDEQRRLENEFTNRMEDYAKAHWREVEKTGIAKINLEKLAVAATGNVPGMLLNQFSLDEYNNNLRLAVTVGGSGFFGFGIGQSGSMNDVYVLGPDLKTLGSVKDLGITERIYSARFIEDKGYLVTFRQVDPFYVLDLSNPKSPKLAGELKIPGYSSYLHPIAKDRILGIGQDGSKVKISLFDVSSASDPKEAGKYLLDEYWTEVSSNHHAFLADPEHEIFFLPAGQSGYIFSYTNDQLGLKKVVSNIIAKRAVYLGDYLYVIGEDKITVLNEKDWTEVNKLTFD